MQNSVICKIGPMPFSVNALQDLIGVGLIYRGKGWFYNKPFAVDYSEVSKICAQHKLEIEITEETETEPKPTGLMAQMMIYTGALTRVL